MQTLAPPQFYSCFNERCAICWFEWKNNILIFAIFTFSILRYSYLIVFVRIVLWFLSAKSTITHKIKIGKIGKLIFHSNQHIAHLPLKWEQNSGRGGLHILSWICRPHRFLYLRLIYHSWFMNRKKKFNFLFTNHKNNIHIHT